MECTKGDVVCRHEHRFRRKLGVTQGLLFCLLRSSLPKRRGWKVFPGGTLPLASHRVGIEALRWGGLFQSQGLMMLEKVFPAPGKAASAPSPGGCCVVALAGASALMRSPGGKTHRARAVQGTGARPAGTARGGRTPVGQHGRPLR